MPKNKQNKTGVDRKTCKGRDPGHNAEKGGRSYYYDDAHGYEDYVPGEDKDGEGTEAASAVGAVDADDDAAPVSLMKPEKAEGEP